MPWNLPTLGHVIDAQTGPLEDRVERPAAIPDHLGQGVGVSSIGTLPLRCHRARRGVEGHQQTRLRLDQREPTCKRRARPSKGICPCGIDNNDTGFELERGKWPRVIGNSQRLGGDIGISDDLRVDRNDVILAFELQPVAADIDERDGIRPGVCGLLHKISESAAQRVLVEIASTRNIETGCLESLCDQASIIGRRVQGSGLIAGIADDERNALFNGGRAWLERAWLENECKRDQSSQSN